MVADEPTAAPQPVRAPGTLRGDDVLDRREQNPWLGLVLDAVGDQFGVPFPPPKSVGRSRWKILTR